MSNPVNHAYILGEDPAALKRFYTAAFGWGTVPHPDGESVIAETGAATLKLGSPEADSDQRIVLWAEVEDLDAIMSAAERAGGRVHSAPATLVNGGPRIARIIDPEGNVVGVARRGREAFTALKGGPPPAPASDPAGNPVIHFELRGQDADGLARFYREVFGWNVLPHPEPGVSRIESGDSGGMTGSIGPRNADNPHLTVFIHVEDVEATLSTVTGLGGEIASQLRRIPHGPVIAHFADPAGNVIGVASGASQQTYEKFLSTLSIPGAD
jgi:predicted enzyme related to lactoylglutathione lyase